MPITIEKTKGEDYEPEKTFTETMAERFGIKDTFVELSVTQTLMHGLINLLIEKDLLSRDEILQMIHQKKTETDQRYAAITQNAAREKVNPQAVSKIKTDVGNQFDKVSEQVSGS